MQGGAQQWQKILPKIESREVGQRFGFSAVDVTNAVTQETAVCSVALGL